MPPPVSSPEPSESDGVDEIPAKPAPLPMPVEAADDEDDEEMEDEEYVVEKIVNHTFDKKGELKYHVRWAGYPKKEDMTWEPVSNLETAPDAIAEYKATIGGTPEPGDKKKGAKGGSAKKPASKRGASEAFDSPAPASSAKKAKGGRKSDTNGVAPKQEREYPAGLWETEVLQVASIVEDSVKNVAKGGKVGKETSMLFGLLEWQDGHRSQHPLRTLRTKCPQKLLDYYEQHLVFTKDD